MDTYYEELAKLLPHDHPLIRSCAAALTSTDITLTQHLLQLRGTVTTLSESMPSDKGEMGGLGQTECADGACSDRVDGGDGVRLSSTAVNGEADDRSVEVGEEVWEENGEERREEAKVHLALGLEEERLGRNAVPTTGGMIQAGSDFPSGPIRSDFLDSGEPDLEHTLYQEEDTYIDATLSRADGTWITPSALVVVGNSAESAVVEARREEVPEANRCAEGSGAVGVARSQSQAIPPDIASYMLNNLQLNNSTPNSTGGNSSVESAPSGYVEGTPSLGGSVSGTPSLEASMGCVSSPRGSVGGIVSLGDSEFHVSLDPPLSTLEHQGGLECHLDKDAIARRTRQMSWHATSTEEDVIAVPVTTRSAGG